MLSYLKFKALFPHVIYHGSQKEDFLKLPTSRERKARQKLISIIQNNFIHPLT